jgi:hypothetical protein
MKILYAFLNLETKTNTPVNDIIFKHLGTSSGVSFNDIILINPYNQYDKFESFLSYVSKIIHPKGTTVSNFRNCALNHAKNNGYDYCFIIDDYITINDTTIYQRYIDLAEKFQFNLVMNGYGYKHPNGQNNYVYNNPNPVLRVWLDEKSSVLLNRFPCESFMLFKIRKDMVLFDERLKSLYLPQLLEKMVEKKHLPINGFNIDLEQSWKLITCSGSAKLDSIHTSQENFQSDMKIIGKKIDFSNDADKILNYINERK